LDEKVLYLALNMASGIGPGKKLALLEHFRDIRTLFSVDSGEIERLIPGKGGSSFAGSRKIMSLKAESEALKAEKMGIATVHVNEKHYPANLLSIPDPPIVLYYKGEPSKEDFNSIAVVGCRKATVYGLKNSLKLGRGLADNGISVISGLAKGIDSEAHKGALERGGRTVAILGCGVDRVFPKEHKALQDEISETGCLYSEFPIGSDPKPFHFPMRNRIICGMAVGVVVVEGSQDSGSLYTAQYALDYGRELYAYPGPAQSYNYSGTHLLIKKGARLVEDVDDLLEDLKLVLDFSKLDKKKSNKINQAMPNGENNIMLIKEENKTGINLSEEEELLLNCLYEESKSIDRLVEETKLPVNQVMSILSSLTIKKQVERRGNYYMIAGSGAVDG